MESYQNKFPCEFSCRGFIIHGDLWSNNVLFDGDNDCRILDWQFTDVGSIFFDLGTLAFYSMSPKETEQHLGSLIAEYYSMFVRTCKGNGLEHSDIPWSEERFISLAKEWGHYTAFLWGVVTYCLVKTYPSFTAFTALAVVLNLLLYFFM